MPCKTNTLLTVNLFLQIKVSNLNTSTVAGLAEQLSQPHYQVRTVGGAQWRRGGDGAELKLNISVGRHYCVAVQASAGQCKCHIEIDQIYWITMLYSCFLSPGGPFSRITFPAHFQTIFYTN